VVGDARSMQRRAEKNIYRLLVGESERRRALGRTRVRWKDDAKINNGGINMSMWTGFIWLGKGRENPERLLTCQEEFWSVELVIT